MKQAIARIHSRLPGTREGLSLFRKYDTLLSARYVDDDGDFQSGLEISSTDRANLEKLFKTYLQWLPFHGTLSSEQARGFLSSGMELLRKRADQQKSPDEDNSSEIQILARQIEDERHHVGELVDLADSWGYKVDAKALAGPAPASAH